MVPHPLIHLKLAQIRYQQLLAAEQRRSIVDVDAARDERRRKKRGPEANTHACTLFVRRLVRHGAELRAVETHFAHREAGCLTVDLYWTHGEHGDTFRVDVVDHRSETTFTLHPRTGKEAVAAYHHPFATTVRGPELDVAA